MVSPTQKKCRDCGKLFTPRDPAHSRCDDCQRSNQPRRGLEALADALPPGERPSSAGRPAGAPRPIGPPPSGMARPAGPGGGHGVRFGGGLPAGYLEGGYFDEKGNVRPAVLVDDAITIARALGNRTLGGSRVSSTQLRRFFNKTRLIEQRLEAGGDFAAVGADITSLKAIAAYAVGRGTAPELFKQFIDRNVDLAMRGEKSFREGFIGHFQSVVAYFKYEFPQG